MLTLTEYGGKDENDRVAYPASVSIHLKKDKQVRLLFTC